MSDWKDLFCVCLICGFLAGLPSLAQEPAAGDQSWLWVSKNRSLEQLDDEITHLYQVLAEAKALPTQTFLDTEGKQLVTILRDQGLYFGTNFEKTNEALLCALNADKCRRQEVDPASGGLAFRWTNGAGDQVVIPDLEFTVDNDWVLYAKKKGEDLRPLLAKLHDACAKVGLACDELLAEMNDSPEAVLEQEHQGLVWLPLLRVRTLLDLTDRPELRDRLKRNLAIDLMLTPHPTELEDKLPPAVFDPGGFFKQLEPEGPSTFRDRDRLYQSPLGGPSGSGRPSSEGLSKLAMVNGSDFSFDTQRFRMERNVERLNGPLPDEYRAGSVPFSESTGVSFRAEASETDPAERMSRLLSDRQGQVFRSINLPSAGELASDAFDVLVAVVDHEIDPLHCGLDPDLVQAYDYQGQPIEVKKGFTSQGCGKFMYAPDHGTYVAGLIAANGVPAQLRGVNPAAHVKAYALDVDAPKIDYATAKRIFNLARRKRPDVLNLSWEYSTIHGEVDPVQEALKSLEPKTLVVVAAGNFGREHDENGCTHRPACLNLPNILVVAALGTAESDAELWTDGKGDSSDYGRQRVHLAAPGREIPSIAKRNSCGSLSGTSSAAPLVAGAASLLYAQRAGIDPVEVRNRLIYTSDLIPGLMDRLLGGRLNVRLALDNEMALVTLGPGARVTCGDRILDLPEGARLRGEVDTLQAPDETARSRSFQIRHLDKDRSDEWIKIVDLKRMTLHSWSNSKTYSLFKVPENDPNALERVEVRLETPGRLMLMDDVESEHQGIAGSCRFELRHMEDYVAPMD